MGEPGGRRQEGQGGPKRRAASSVRIPTGFGMITQAEFSKLLPREQLGVSLTAAVRPETQAELRTRATMSVLDTPVGAAELDTVTSLGFGTVKQGNLFPEDPIMPPHFRVATGFEHPELGNSVIVINDSQLNWLMSGKRNVFDLVNERKEKRAENLLERYIRRYAGFNKKFGRRKGRESDIVPVEGVALRYVIDLIQTAEMIRRDGTIQNPDHRDLVQVRTMPRGEALITLENVTDKALFQRVTDPDAASIVKFARFTQKLSTPASDLLKAYDAFYADPNNAGVREEIRKAVALTIAGGEHAERLRTQPPTLITSHRPVPPGNALIASLRDSHKSSQQ